MRPHLFDALVRRPRPLVGWSVAAAVTALWGALRLVVFGTILFPLTYTLPLLLCVWTRDRLMLWLMASTFVVMHTIKQFWIMPAAPAFDTWATYGATLFNIGMATLIVHAMIVLRDRVERYYEEIAAQSEELARQNEELAQQSEEISAQAEEVAAQNEELTQVSEELSAQNEELHTQSEDIQVLNAQLQHREALLQALLDAARTIGSERTALQRVCGASLSLLGAPIAAVIVSERVDGALVIRAVAGLDEAALPPRTPGDAGLAAVAIAQNRTASIHDLALRPDFAVVHGDGRVPFGAALSAPIRGLDGPFGALTLLATGTLEWTSHQYALAEWLADQAGHILQILRLHRELEQTHETLRDTDRRKTEFLATLSHELRNPLSAMRYALELLPREAAPPVGPSRTVLQRQLAHLTRLVDDLLDLSRVVSNRIQLRSERVDLLAVVRDTVATVQGDAAAKSHRLTVSAPETPLWTTGDAVRLTQVVANLLTNAVRYTPPGGHIRVTLEPEDGGAAIVVADTGVGLERDDLPRVFQMFTQVGEPGQGGLGIGLALVKEIVDLHGGRVHAQSGGPGCGAEFTVWLPLAVAADAHADRESPRQSAPPPRRILVVDDNVDAADMLKALLEFDGHDVSVAHDGSGALRCAQQAAHDIGLFDVGLPDMSGYELAQALRRDPATERMFLIAVTGWGQPEDREKAFAHGFHAHLTKPATPDAIREQVRAAAARLAGGEQAHRS